MDNKTISCPRCMKSLTLVINNGGGDLAIAIKNVGIAMNNYQKLECKPIF